MDITSSQVNSTEEEVETKTCREKLRIILSNHKFHVASLCLIVIEALIVLMLLLVDLDVIIVHGSSDEERHKNKDKAEKGLHYTGLTILTIFVIEVILKIIAEGKAFFKQCLEVFDAIIVCVSFILDIILSIAPVKAFVRDAVVMMIILRLWRFSRIITSVFICVRKGDEDKLEKEKAARKAAESERDQANTELENIKVQLKQLEQLQAGNPGSEPTENDIV